MFYFKIITKHVFIIIAINTKPSDDMSIILIDSFSRYFFPRDDSAGALSAILLLYMELDQSFPRYVVGCVKKILA